MTGHKNNVYIMGFMGCGKTKIGSLLARKLGFSFIDTDMTIEKESGMRINEIFDREGESGFRAREKNLVERISRLEHRVVSLGGGTVIDLENWRMISESGTTVALSYPPEIIALRLENKKDRPLLNAYSGKDRLDRIASLMAERECHYRRADLFLHLNREVEPGRIASALTGFLGERA
jgi:shikimate kinase